MMRRQLLALALFAVVTSLYAQQPPNTARGFVAERAYQIGDVDHINLFNGNLIVTIPIGPTYPVGGSFSYALHAVYNGNPFNYRYGDTTGNPTDALPSRVSYAGLGWQISLGDLISPNSPQAVTTGGFAGWTYVTSDGAEKYFYPRLHAEDGSPSNGQTLCRDCNLDKKDKMPPQ